MPLSRSSLNLVFAIVVVVLGSTAVVSIYQKTAVPEVRTPPAESGRLPANHPPLDVSGKIAALQQLSAREPQNAEYPVQIGNLYYDTGEYAKAAEFYQKSLGLRPNDPSVETDLASCYHYMGQDDKSLELLDRILGYSPGFSQAKFNKGVVLIEGKKDVQAGLAVWEELLRSDPGYSQRAELEQRIAHLKSSPR